VQGIFDDRTDTAIAADLKVSPHTVHTYIERLYRRLGVTGRVKLVLRVLDEFNALTLAPGTILSPLCAISSTDRCPLSDQKSRSPTSRCPLSSRLAGTG
jgi:hypothetical protein